MKQSKASVKRYSTALIKAAGEENKVKETGEDLKSLVDIFSANEKIYDVLLNPIQKLEDRVAFATELMQKAGATKTMTKFVALLVERSKIGLLPDICVSYKKTESELSGTINAVIETATDISDDTVKAIQDKLEKETNRKVTITVETNKDLLGGLIIKIGNTVIDGSLKKRLTRLRETILDKAV